MISKEYTTYGNKTLTYLAETTKNIEETIASFGCSKSRIRKKLSDKKPVRYSREERIMKRAHENAQRHP
jgi:hypothetical protein